MTDRRIRGSLLALFLLPALLTAAQIGEKAQSSVAAPRRANAELGGDPAAISNTVDILVRREMAERKLPSVAVAVLRGRVVVKGAAYGHARLDPLLSAGPATRYRLDSVTKQFTAAAVMILQQRGLLRVDDPVAKRLPDVPSSWRQITIRHLLTHTAGFPRDLPAGYTDIAEQGRSTLGLLDRLYTMRPRTPPGVRYQYSNAGYAVLGTIIEKVSGQSYAQFLQANIFGPAGMADTRLDDSNYADPRLAIGYGWDASSRQWVVRGQGNSAAAAASVQSTVLDLAKWEVALQGDTILSAESKKQMWTHFFLSNGEEYDYGFGWCVQDRETGRMIWHDGSGWGYSTAYHRYPDAGYAVIVLTNLQPGKGRDHASAIARKIAALYEPVFRAEGREQAAK